MAGRPAARDVAGLRLSRRARGRKSRDVGAVLSPEAELSPLRWRGGTFGETGRFHGPGVLFPAPPSGHALADRTSGQCARLLRPQPEPASPQVALGRPAEPPRKPGGAIALELSPRGRAVAQSLLPHAGEVSSLDLLTLTLGGRVRRGLGKGGGGWEVRRETKMQSIYYVYIMHIWHQSLWILPENIDCVLNTIIKMKELVHISVTKFCCVCVFCFVFCFVFNAFFNVYGLSEQ